MEPHATTSKMDTERVEHVKLTAVTPYHTPTYMLLALVTAALSIHHALSATPCILRES